MEATGLAVGLAGLFSTCLDIIEKIDYYRDFGVESRSLIAQFEADQVRFREWGKQVGISDASCREHRHQALNDPVISSAVEKILQSIKEIDEDAEKNSASGQATSGPGSRRSYGGAQVERFRGATSRRSRISWTLRGRSRFLAMAQSFAALVQRLYDLVPPGSNRHRPIHGSAESKSWLLLVGVFWLQSHFPEAGSYCCHSRCVALLRLSKNCD